MSNVIATKAKTGRDSRIEMLRLFACFSVLVLHFKPNTFVEGRRILSRTFITCLCTDAVGIFLLISGCFFFGKQNYADRVRSYITKIFIPTIVYTIFVAIGYPVIIGASVDYHRFCSEFVTTIITWNPVIHNAQHLWYMYLYGMLVVAWPVLKKLKETLLTTPMKKLIFLTVVLAFLTANDISNNNILHCDMVPVTVFVPGCLFILAGGIIYEERHRFQGKTVPAILSAAVFTCATAARSVYMRNLLNIDSSASHMYGWYTGIGFVCAVSLTVFVLNLKPFANDILNALSGCTMTVYILHPLVSEIISVMGYRSWIISTFLDGSETFIQFIKFTGIYCLSVFIVCCVMALFLKSVLKIIKRKKQESACLSV
ncbi:MAG: acyltransferase [Oscillospiraceae bacterium]|nr:acyltransferase [Oscillospiraceae bacterium]